MRNVPTWRANKDRATSARQIAAMFNRTDTARAWDRGLLYIFDRSGRGVALERWLRRSGAPIGDRWRPIIGRSSPPKKLLEDIPKTLVRLEKSYMIVAVNYDAKKRLYRPDRALSSHLSLGTLYRFNCTY